MDGGVRLLSRRAKLGRIVTRPAGDDTRSKEIAMGIPYRCHFRPAMPQKPLVAASLDIMLTGMTRLQTGGVHHAGGTLTETTLFFGMRKNTV